MKSVFIIVIFVLGFVQVQAQKSSIELNAPLKANADVSAFNSITLKPGFSTAGYCLSAIIEDIDFPEYTNANPSDDQNYIHTITPNIPVKKQVMEESISLGDWERTYVTDLADNIQYFDGLGRLIQSVSVKQSSSYKDLIQPIVYDDYGRRKQEVLPYTRNLNGGYDENAIKDNNLAGDYFISNQYQFYQTNPEFVHWGNDRQKPYSETVFDGSPLNKVMKQGALGQDWQPDNSTTDRLLVENIISYEYTTNTTESIIILKTNSNNQLVKNSSYCAKSLYITLTKDENGNETYEYKDLQGKVLRKRSDSGNGWLETYYVYDDFGLLRYVIPPKAVSYLGDGDELTIFNNSESWIKELCYYYEYDAKKRMIKKRLPGVKEVKMVYDNRDRLVFTQDGELGRNDLWYFTLYDELNRPAVTGRTTEADGFSSEVSYTFSQAIRNGGSDYTLNSYFLNSIIFTKTYYDDYDYVGVLGYMPEECIAIDMPGNTYETNVKGMITGIKTFSGDLNTIETPYYDDYGREIFRMKYVDIESNNFYEITSTQYDFTGRPVQTRQKQIFESEVNTMGTKILYDHAGRVLRTKQKINNSEWQTISEMEYNELGQLTKKTLGESLQEVDYKYNIRGWLTQINDPDELSADVFAMNLYYNQTSDLSALTPSSQFNGNISAMSWVDTYFDQQKAYAFSYDGINRLTKGQYGEKEATWSAYNKYSLDKVTYDKNGNINKLWRYAADGTYLDKLDYAYNGNQLSWITDQGNSSRGFKDFNTSGNDYDYDYNGNLTKDLNKWINDINYNHLNLPVNIQMENERIDYLYDATGMKYKKRAERLYDPDGNVEERYYFSNFEYDNNMNLEYILTNEGRIRVKDNFANDYFLKDHLGNTRAVFSDLDNDGVIEPDAANSEILQVNNYYPFGMRFGQTPSYQNGTDGLNQYLYNGKEIQEDIDWYDYGARMYDPAIGRWHVMDPLSQYMPNHSPYSYAFNNPVRYVDMFGMFPWDGREDRKKRKHSKAYKQAVRKNKPWKKKAKKKLGLLTC